MFHPPVSDSKQKADSAKTNSPLQRQDAYGTFDGVHARGMPPIAGAKPAARKQNMARLQRAYGNQAVLRMLALSRPAIQPKLVVNQPGDAYEQEADRVADQVMRMPDPSLSVASAPAQLSRKCAECEAEEKPKMLQAKPAGSAQDAVGDAPPIVHEALRSPGQPLDAAARAFFEPRFGHDFSTVRVHSDGSVASSAHAVNARAYTRGDRIVFGAGQYSPDSDDGRRLLAHELAHVVQQSGTTPKKPLRAESAIGSASSRWMGGEIGVQHSAVVNHAVAQRQPGVSNTAAAVDEESLPAGAPAVIEGDVEPVLENEAAEPPHSTTNNNEQLSLKPLVPSSSIVQRQAASPPPAATAPPVVPQMLSWSDFPPVQNRTNGFSAQTGYTWNRDKSGFYTIAFNPATSWSVVADQTDDLLRHEQYHLNLAALISNKANAAVGTMSAAALDKAFDTALKTHDRSYDGDTGHGRNTRLQTLWESDIDAGVPEFPITPATPGR
jgi:hypothetical protein